MCTGYLLWLPVFNKSNNTGEQFKIILINEYGESELSSVMTNNDNSQLTLGLNINTTFPYFSSFDPASSPARRQRKIDRKITFFFFILYPMWPFHEKMINLIYHSPYGFFTRSPKPGLLVKKPTLLDFWCTSQVAISPLVALYICLMIAFFI